MEVTAEQAAASAMTGRSGRPRVVIAVMSTQEQAELHRQVEDSERRRQQERQRCSERMQQQIIAKIQAAHQVE